MYPVFAGSKPSRPFNLNIWFQKCKPNICCGIALGCFLAVAVLLDDIFLLEMKNNLLSVVQKRNAKGTLVFNFVFKSKRRKTQNIDNYTLFIFNFSRKQNLSKYYIIQNWSNKIQRIENKIKKNKQWKTLSTVFMKIEKTSKHKKDAKLVSNETP